jgi:RNA polymerase sigma-54 factor
MLEKTLKTIQRFDPIGIGSRTLQECLEVQLEYYGIEDQDAYTIVREYLPLLERKQFQDIAKKLKVDLDHLKPTLDIIESLEPKPGRKYSNLPTHYVIPDVYVVKLDGEYMVLLNDEGLPRLQVSPLYKNILTENSVKRDKNEPETDSDKESGETKEFLEKKMRSALWLIKSVDQRLSTIRRVSEAIVRKQREFFEHGVRHLKPMVLRDIAEEIDVHESTVSRVSTNKYLHCAQGVFELKFFFHSGISSEDGEDVSSLRIKEIIKEEISNENNRKPLSDKKLAEIIEEKTGVKIARRTVAKYRIDLGISSSSQRKSL